MNLRSTLFLTILFIKTILDCDAQDLHEENLKGKVKTLTVYNYFSKDGNVKPTEKYLEWKSVQNYNNQGKITEFSHFGKDGKLNYLDIYRYDAHGNLEENQSFENGKVTGRHIYEYNPQGHRTRLQSYDADDSIRSSFTYSYNDAGRVLIEKSYFNLENSSFENDSLVVIREHFYDNHGNIIKILVYEPEDLPIVWHLTYDQFNNMTSYSEKDTDGEVLSSMTFSYKYYPNGLKHIMQEISNGKLEMETIYDTKGNITEEQSYIGKKVNKVTYTNFDESGNWLEKRLIDSGKAHTLIIRQTHY